MQSIHWNLNFSYQIFILNKNPMIIIQEINLITNNINNFIFNNYKINK